MNAWEKRKLIDQLSLLKDGTHGTHKDGDFAFLLSAKNVIQNSIVFDDSDRKISEDDFNDVYANYHIKKNDVLLTIVGTIGRVALFPRLTVPVAFQRSVAILRTKPTLFPYFLALELQTPSIQSKIKARANMSAQAGIYLGDLKKIVIAIPKSEEQIEIAMFLNRLTNLIAATQQKISDLEDIKVNTLRSLFNQTWRIRHYSDDWKNTKLSDISTKVVEKNVNYQYKEVLTNSAEFGIVNQQDFFDKSIANPKSLSGYYVIHPNDFVYNPRISKLAPVGPVRRNKTGRIGVMSPLYYVFKIDGVDPTFLEYFFKNNGWHRFMYANGDTGARADRFAIKDKVFEQMPIRLPSKDEQEALGTLLKALERLIAEFLERLDNLKKLKKYLLSSMFA